MTAIFAFVFARKAIVATDTLRVDPMGLFPNRTVQKSYCWKNLIPFGAAGTGALIGRVADLMAMSESLYQADESGFLKAFHDARMKVIDAINASENPLERAVAGATVLAAIPSLSSNAGHILHLDFGNGSVTTCPGDFAAEGTRSTEFMGIAGNVLSGMSGGSIDAFNLTRNCISEAIKLCPAEVGWPMDLRVSESGDNNRAVHLRLDPRMPKDFLTLT